MTTMNTLYPNFKEKAIGNLIFSIETNSFCKNFDEKGIVLKIEENDYIINIKFLSIKGELLMPAIPKKELPFATFTFKQLRNIDVELINHLKYYYKLNKEVAEAEQKTIALKNQLKNVLHYVNEVSPFLTKDAFANQLKQLLSEKTNFDSFNHNEAGGYTDLYICQGEKYKIAKNKLKICVSKSEFIQKYIQPKNYNFIDVEYDGMLYIADCEDAKRELTKYNHDYFKTCWKECFSNNIPKEESSGLTIGDKNTLIYTQTVSFTIKAFDFTKDNLALVLNLITK